MSLGWSFTSFDFSAWRRLTGGAATPEDTAALRAAASEDATWCTAAELEARAAAASVVARVGLGAAYRDAGPDELVVLDLLVVSLFEAPRSSTCATTSTRGAGTRWRPSPGSPLKGPPRACS